VTDSGSLPHGRQPYDRLNGIRVGGFAGALLGGVATWLLGVGFVWLVLLLAALGGIVGYLWERRQT
jgi:hypothetical protein